MTPKIFSILFLGMGCGDYPHLPDIPVEQRDIYYPYDYPELRRNFQEPVHAELDHYDETRVGTPAPLRFPIWKMGVSFLSVIAGAILIFWLLDDKKAFRPVLEKQMPTPGQVHYTFETKTT